MLYPINSLICVNPHPYSKLPHDGLKSFVPVAMTVRFGYLLLANPKCPANDIAGLMTAAKAQPGKFNFGSAGVGAGNHVVMTTASSISQPRPSEGRARRIFPTCRA